MLGLCCRTGFSLVVASGVFSLAVVHGFSLQWLLLVAKPGSQGAWAS